VTELAGNPYVGLRPYEAEEALLFLGRTEQVTELLQRLHDHRFVAVVGGSGSGKSSLLRAGLIPNLKAGYLVSDSDHWLIAIMKPGRNPMFNMAAALLQGVDPKATREEVAAFVERIEERGVEAVLDLVRPLRERDHCNFFLLVDQFEELFRFAMGQGGQAGKDESIDFVNIVLELSRQEDIPFHVVLTMRSDFIGDCAQFFGLPEALNTSQYLVPRMTRSQLKLAIEGPARLFNTPVDPELTSRLMNDLGKVRDELPLLSHVLMRAWEHEKNVDRSGTVRLEDYESVGGIEHALSRHADEALAEFSEKERELTRSIFQELTAIDDHGRKIRRPVSVNELKQVTGANEERLLHIVRQFIRDNRSFLILSETADGRDRVIDISHESLIRQWDRLSDWVTAEGEAAQTLKQLVQACRQHQLGKKGLLDSSELQSFLAWRALVTPRQAWADRYLPGLKEALAYLDDSEAEDRRRKEEERKAVIRKWRNRVVWLALLLLILLAGGGTWAIQEHNELLATTQELDSLRNAPKPQTPIPPRPPGPRPPNDSIDEDLSALGSARDSLGSALDSIQRLRFLVLTLQGGLELSDRLLRAEQLIPKCPDCLSPIPPTPVCLSPTVTGKLALQDLERMKGDPRRNQQDSLRVRRALGGALDAFECCAGGSYALSTPTSLMRMQGTKLLALDDGARLYRMNPEKWPDQPRKPAPVSQDRSSLSNGGRAFLGHGSMLLVDKDKRLSLCSLDEDKVIASTTDSLHAGVTAMTTLMNNQVLVTGHEDGSLIWWTVQPGLLIYKGQKRITGRVKALLSDQNKVYAVGEEGSVQYSGGFDEAAGVVDLQSGRLTAVTSDDNGKIYAGSDGGNVWLRGSNLIWRRIARVQSNAIEHIAVNARGDIALVSSIGNQSYVNILVPERKQDGETEYRNGLSMVLKKRPMAITLSPMGDKLYLAYADGSVERIHTTLDAMKTRLVGFVGTSVLTPAEEAERKACEGR
jgi:energy-coupling factor transporter ATP-binding protein EcfA2